MKKFEVTKEFSWEMGHRLLRHKGACRNLHGHSYIAAISLQKENVDIETGMVVDFSELTNVVKPLIDSLDHSFMFNKGDKVGELLMQEFPDLKYNLVSEEPTAECIAKMIFNYIDARSYFPIARVTVWETAKCSATYGE
jgi:6-pyruvoyltetrahydropterin/6-carboxytetrahydropterin synthase